MISANVNAVELNEFAGKTDPRQHCRATFPLVGFHGAKEIASVYFELEPGNHLGKHTDSAEELLVILEGKAEVLVGNETAAAGKGALVLVPRMQPHDIKNIGATTVKVLGVFGANNIVATFEQAMLPTNSRVVDTASLFQEA